MTDVIGPTIDGVQGKPWFFMRYWQAGPHLRLRIADLDHADLPDFEQSLRERLETVGALSVDDEPLDPAAHNLSATRLAALGEGGKAMGVEPVLAPGVYRRQYEPELERYGGAAVMTASERLFQMSSELVLAFLPHVLTARSRSMMSMRATMSAVSALGSDAEQTNFYERGIQFWRSSLVGLGYSEGQLDQLCQVPDRRVDKREESKPKPAPSSPDPLQPWSSAVAALLEEVRHKSPTPTGQVLFSHVHMLHNRLGLTLVQELQTYVRLAHLSPAADG